MALAASARSGSGRAADSELGALQDRHGPRHPALGGALQAEPPLLPASRGTTSLSPSGGPVTCSAALAEKRDRADRHAGPGSAPDLLNQWRHIPIANGIQWRRAVLRV